MFSGTGVSLKLPSRCQSPAISQLLTARRVLHTAFYLKMTAIDLETGISDWDFSEQWMD